VSEHLTDDELSATDTTCRRKVVDDITRYAGADCGDDDDTLE
jgi:hypothetical protein